MWGDSLTYSYTHFSNTHLPLAIFLYFKNLSLEL